MESKKDTEDDDKLIIPKNTLSISSLISGTSKLDNRKKISQNLIGRTNMDDIYFIPIGTEVSGIRRGGPNSEILIIEDYYISEVKFSMFESKPLYSIQKMTNDGDLLNMYEHNSFAESTLVFKNKEKIQKSIFSPYCSTIVLPENETKEMLEERYKKLSHISCSLVLTNEEFILPGEIVYIATNTRDAQIVSAVVIDKDWIVNYRLKNKDNFYINSELVYGTDTLIEDMTLMTCKITI